MKIKFVVKKGNGCDWHRLFVPLDNMPFTSQDEVEMGIYGEDEDPGDCDIYMFNRDVSILPTELLRLKKERGFRIVMDLDDYWNLPPSHYLYEVWNNDECEVKIISYLLIADVVTTTNAQLKEKIIRFNPNVVIYPNVTSFDKVVTSLHDKMRFMYVGGITHLPDIKLLESPFKRIGDDPYLKVKAEFILSGFDSKTPSPTWDAMAKVFSYTNTFRVYSSLPLDKYMEHYEHADVCLVPLVSNTFNSCKSTLKLVEAASCKKPCIVSDVLPYSDLKGAPGILWVNNGSDWLKHIRFCTKNPQWVEDEGNKLYEYMREHYNVKDWAVRRYNDLKQLL